MGCYMKRKLKKHSLYSVDFLDHTAGIDHDINIRICAFFVKENQESYVFSPWLVQHDDQSIVENNYEYITIVKSCIRKIKELRL